MNEKKNEIETKTSQRVRRICDILAENESAENICNEYS